MTNALTTEPENAVAVVQQVESFLDVRLKRAELPANLVEAIRYAVLGGGKMLRPQLAIRSCEAAGGDAGDVIGPAAALELIHAFSLVHDDLPAMDDDDLRRGRPTLHIHAGEAMAILAGDTMMSLAFQIILEEAADADRGRRLCSELATGTTAMIGGQVYDTLGGFPDGLSEIEQLKLIHRNKTGALIRAACRMGGICAGANDEVMGALTQYGEASGLMFQVVDDLLDVTQSAEHIGKATGKDAEAGKLTFPGLLGIDGSREEVERCQKRAIDALRPLGPAADPLRELCRYMARRTK
ncbi:MAG: polyprenyl synthetase family protein [Phycisphaerales bacterium]|nr:MAG: polyprenyl synthetase family protein [Phycisphaerales bacterium]